jgi:outer membrane protein W
MEPQRIFRDAAAWFLGVVVVLVPSGVVFSAEEQPAGPAPVAEVSEEMPKPRERNWRVRLTGAFANDQDGIIATSITSSGTRVSIAGGVGGGVNFEYRYSPRMGIEMGAMGIAGGINVGTRSWYGRYSTTAEVGSYVPITFALNFHPIREPGIFDFYVGPLAASTIVSSVGVGTVVGIESRVDLGLGANLGFDINFGKRSRWSFNSGLKYISNLTNDGDDTRIAFDPLIWTFGFGFKF